MRNVRALLAISAVSLVAVGCLKEQKPVAPPPQLQAAPPPVAEVPPAPPPVEQPAPPAETGAAQPGQEQQQAPVPVTQSTHDLVIDALLCGLPPGPIAPSIGGGPSPSGAGQPPGAAAPEATPAQPAEPQGATPPAAHGEARCTSLAPNVSANDFRQLDETAVRAVRDQIERRASEERLDDTMRLHLLALYDRGIAAEREALAGEKIGDRLSVAGAQRTAKQRPHAQTTGREGRAMGAGIRERQQRQAIPQADLATLSSHERLRDLLQFARTSDSGALGTEAEGLAWVLGADRFVQVEALPPRLRPFAAEPLFDALLGVPTPPEAQALDATKVTPAVWSQYLETAARTVGVGVAPSPTGAVDHDPFDASFAKQTPKKGTARGHGHAAPHPRGHGAIGGGQQAAPPGAAHPARRGHPGQAARDQQNVREILTAVSQRMEALSRRMPASDLRVALDIYATDLQSSQIGVGGGPARPVSPRPEVKPPPHVPPHPGTPSPLAPPPGHPNQR